VTLTPDRAPVPTGEPGACRVRRSAGLPASLTTVGVLRMTVADALERAAWPSASRGDVLLAVDEAVDNAVEHGSRPLAPVDFDLDVDQHSVRVAVTDRGGSCPLEDGAPTPPPTSSTHGRGRLIMAALADEVEWRRLGGGVRVRLRFRRTRARSGTS
jgi:serine/threonine-protein kinase RsbW